MSGKYNHAFDFAVEVTSNHPEGDDVTGRQLRDALVNRALLLSDNDLLNACNMFDTMDQEGEKLDGQTHEATLPYGDYVTPEGAWLTVGEAAIRVTPDEHGNLKIGVWAKGQEDAEPVQELFVHGDDIKSAPDDDEPGL